MIALVTPLHRPVDIENVRANWLRLGGVLIVVENGAGIGACRDAGFEPSMLVQSNDHQSHARNAGIEAAQALGADGWAMLDADDYYGPGYIAKVEAALQGAELVAQSSAYVRLSDGRLLLLSGRTDPHFGSTLASNRFDLRYRVPDTAVTWEDDTLLLADAQAAGVTLGTMGPEGHVYRRDRGAHISPATDAQLVAGYRAGCTPERDHVEDFGPSTPDNFADDPHGSGTLLPRPSAGEIMRACAQ